MKSGDQSKRRVRAPRITLRVPNVRCWAVLLLLLLTAAAVSAAETNAPAATTAPVAQTNAPVVKAAAPMTPEQMFEGGTNAYENWVDLGMGGFFINGNKAQFQQSQQRSGNLYGGIEDFHVQGDIAKGTTFWVDGHSIFDENDYKLSLGVTKEKLGYLRLSYGKFRTWDNGSGGFYPPADLWYALPGNGLTLDHEDLSVEAGLTLEKMPQIAALVRIAKSTVAAKHESRGSMRRKKKVAIGSSAVATSASGIWTKLMVPKSKPSCCWRDAMKLASVPGAYLRNMASTCQLSRECIPSPVASVVNCSAVAWNAVRICAIG